MKGKLPARAFWTDQMSKGGGNFCTKVVILWEIDKWSGHKEIVKIFQSVTHAKKYRRRLFADKYLGRLNELFPIEVWAVTWKPEEIEGKS